MYSLSYKLDQAHRMEQTVIKMLEDLKSKNSPSVIISQLKCQREMYRDLKNFYLQEETGFTFSEN